MMRSEEEVLVQKVYQYLEEHNVLGQLTGSYAIGGYHSESDIDIVVDGSKGNFSVVGMTDQLGVDITFGGSVNGENMTESYRVIDCNVNIIICYNEILYQSWVAATRIARSLNMESKPHRIAVFEYYKDKAHEAIKREGERQNATAMGKGFIPF